MLMCFSIVCTQVTIRRADNATKGFSALFLLEVLCRMAYEGVQLQCARHAVAVGATDQ